MPARLIEFFVESVQDPSPVVKYQGALDVEMWRNLFTDVLLQADDAVPPTVHLCIVRMHDHCAVACWQISEAHNRMLLAHEAAANPIAAEHDDSDDGGDVGAA